MFIVEDIYDVYDLLEEKKNDLYDKIEKDNSLEFFEEYEDSILSIFEPEVSLDRNLYRVSRSNRLGTFLDLVVLLAKEKESETHYIMFVELKVEGFENYDDFDALDKLLKEKIADGSLGKLRVKLQDAYCEEMTIDDLE